MAYRADIEIAVRGAQELKRLQNEIRIAADAVNSLNSNISSIANLIPRSFNNLSKTVADAAKSFNAAALGTDEATEAARKYVQATDELNAGLRERVALLAKIRAEQRITNPGDAGTGQQTPALPPKLIRTYEIGQNWVKFFDDAARVAVDLGARSLNTKASWNDFFASAAQAAVSVKANSLNTKASWNDFFASAAQAAVSVKANSLNTKASWTTFFTEAAQLADDLTANIRKIEAERSVTARSRLASAAQTRQERATFLAGAPVSQFPFGPAQASTRRRFTDRTDTSVERAEGALRAKELRAQRALNVQLFAEEKAQIFELDRLRTASSQKQIQQIQAIGKAVRGSLSSAAIGGAFPLLFGQSPQAAVGGALGGLLGGAGGGFAGSLIGTALGELEAAKARTKELALELGLTSTQAQTLATAFELAGRNSQQLEAAVTNIQGLGLSTTETASAIKIVVELSKEYGGSVEKIAQAFADTLESGKVSISTLNKFTAQGIPIQEELADKLKVSRSKLLEMARDGQISVQQVTDALVSMGIEAENTADKGKTGFDRFTAAVAGIASAIAGAAGAILKNLIPALDTVLTKLAAIITRATTALSLIADAQIGEASAALFRSGTSRGIFKGFAQSKGNIDDLTQGLQTLKPLLATNRDELDKFQAVADRYTKELQQYGGQVGEYAVGTAQVELTRVKREIATRERALGAVKPTPTGIENINAPANISPKGGGTDKAAKDAAREAQRVLEALRDQRLITIEIERQSEFSKKIFDAEIAKDPVLVRQLQGAQQLAELGVETAKRLEDEKNKSVQLAIAKTQQAKQALIRQKTEQDVAKIEKDRVDNARRTIDGLQNELEIKNATTQAERDRLRIAYEMKVLEDGKQFTSPELDDIRKAKEALAAPTLGVKLIRQQSGALSDELLKLTDVGTQITQIAQNIGTAFSESFKGVISGTMTAQEALASFFQSVADRFLDMAAQIIAKMIEIQILNAALSIFPGFGGGLSKGADIGVKGFFLPSLLPGKAAGGSVMAGSPYMVGERGPELFVPGRSGTIVPNSALGSGGSTSVVVNVDASGSNVQGDGAQAGQLGKAIGIAVQQELIKQKRPGGLLAGV